MCERIDLVWLTQSRKLPKWYLGEVWVTEPLPSSICCLVKKKLLCSQAVAWLFWDEMLGEPEAERVLNALKQPGDLWHAGLKLGMTGLPRLIDFVHPTWMLNKDPDPKIEATSWRLSLQACLVKIEVLRQMQGPRPNFSTLTGASLEMGHRYIMRGVVMRYLPWLVGEKVTTSINNILTNTLPFVDEIKFIYYRFGRFWARWALIRAIMERYVSVNEALKAWQKVKNELRPKEPTPYTRHLPEISIPENPKVSVLIPTLDRYSYLRTLLNQLRQQTVKPFEIIIVDQTPLQRRQTNFAEEFSDLPINVIFLDHLGQCSSRNEGLFRAKGDFILFLDDDEEVPPSLIEDHLRTLIGFRADVSSGGADEVGAGPLPELFTYLRVSDVFPTNNTLIRKEILSRSGLFDLAYEKGERADADLGMRVYLSGALMILNPSIRILHHHASYGGLRVHKARVITYASSRKYITYRHLPSVTEIYLAKRYFNQRQVKEKLLLQTLGTLSLHGSWWKRLLKIVLGILLLPNTYWKIRKHYLLATEMLKRFPTIPMFIETNR